MQQKWGLLNIAALLPSVGGRQEGSEPHLRTVLVLAKEKAASSPRPEQLGSFCAFGGYGTAPQAQLCVWSQGKYTKEKEMQNEPG